MMMMMMIKRRSHKGPWSCYWSVWLVGWLAVFDWLVVFVCVFAMCLCSCVRLFGGAPFVICTFADHRFVCLFACLFAFVSVCLFVSLCSNGICLFLSVFVRLFVFC